MEHILKVKSHLSVNEITFIFDFLLEMSLNAQTLEQNAVSIGTHLIHDFYEKSSRHFDRILKEIRPQSRRMAELLALNFEMRSKKFIEDVSRQ